MSSEKNLINSNKEKSEKDVFIAPEMPLKRTKVKNKKDSTSNGSSVSLSNNKLGNLQQTSKRPSKFSYEPPKTLVSSVPTQSLLTETNHTTNRLNAKMIAIARAQTVNEKLKEKTGNSDQTLSIPPVSYSVISNPLLSLIQICPTTKCNDVYTAKVDINDLPLPLRTNLTQVQIQETLSKQTNSTISTRGSYLTAVEKKNLDTINKQLHLFIHSPIKDQVNIVIDRVKDLIINFKPPNISSEVASNINKNNKIVFPTAPNQPGLPTGNYFQEKLFVGMETAPVNFNLKAKLTGPNCDFFNYIANLTGSKVILRGRGSGFIEPTSGKEAFEAMYVFISHPTKYGVEKAKTLVINLIQKVKGDLEMFMKGNVNYTPPSLTYNSHLHSSCNKSVSAYSTIANNVNTLAMYPTMNLNYSNAFNNMQPTIPNSNLAAAKNKIVKNSASVVPAESANSLDNISSSQSEQKSVSKDVKEVKHKKRRFQEEVPDYSKVLGYKQYSKELNFESVIDKQKSTDTVNKKTKVEQSSNDNMSENLPFWMSLS